MEQLFIDEETGESLMQPFLNNLEENNSTGAVNNAETGEPEVNIITTVARKSRKVPFQIPKKVKDDMMLKKSGSKRCDNIMEMEPVPVGTSFGQVNPICLFLPAIIYSRWILVFLMIFEVTLHLWAHRKNKTLKNGSEYYFRSPFHAVSSEFCALCQNETCMNRVEKMQEIRLHKFIRQCNYVKRIVT